MALAHKFKEKDRTNDVLITESVDFSGLLLPRDVVKGLQDAGFQKPSPIQLKAIPLGRSGLDLIVQAKSGTGKTCVFTVIALENVDVNFSGIQVLVLAPTREIALQIHDVVKTVGSAISGLKCHTFIGGLSRVLQDKVSAKNCHIAIGTPGRVKQLIEIGAIDTTSIRLFVLDEADILLEGDFQDPINWIYSSLPENKQILALSATYPEYLAHHLTAYMRNPTFVRLNISDPALLGIKQFHISVLNHALPNVVFNSKAEMVIKLLSSINFQQCLIFSNMQTRAKNLQSELQSRKWPTACIAGCLDQKERNFAMEQLKTYKCRILISTDLTSRGIDADKVNLVINLDIPTDHETYLHRIGRGGRFGSHGAAITIITESEYKQLRDIEKKCNTRIKKLPEPIPKDLIARVETVSLDEIVTSEQIINKPTEMQPEAGKKSESDSNLSDYASGSSDNPEAGLDRKDEKVTVHENSVEADNDKVNSDSKNVCETKEVLPESEVLSANDMSCELKEKETVMGIQENMTADSTCPGMSLSHELEKKKTSIGGKEALVDPMPPFAPDISSYNEVEEKNPLENDEEIPVDQMLQIIPNKEIPVDLMPPIKDNEIVEKETLEGSEKIQIDPMPTIVPDKCTDNEMEEKKTLEGSEEIQVDPLPPIVPAKCTDNEMEEKKTFEGSEEIQVDPMPPIVPAKCTDNEMEEKKTLEGSEEIQVDPLPPIVPDNDMEEKKTFEGSEEIQVDPLSPIVPDNEMEQKETLEGSDEIPVDSMPPIVSDKCPDNELEEMETLEGSEEILVNPMPPVVPDKCSDMLPALEMSNILAEPDNTEILQVADNILCNDVLKCNTNQHVTTSEDLETSPNENVSLFGGAQQNTANSLHQANVKEDDMVIPSPVSDFASKNDKTFRHRRRTPRSLAVSDFLQSVNDDFLALRIKDVGGGGDSLKCSSMTFSTSESNDRAPKKSDEIVGQGSTMGKSTGNQNQCTATSMIQPLDILANSSVLGTDEMCKVDKSLLGSSVSTKIDLMADDLCAKDSTQRAVSNVVLKKSSEATLHEPASDTVQEQNTIGVQDIGAQLTQKVDTECVDLSNKSSDVTENSTELTNKFYVDADSTTKFKNKPDDDAGSRCRKSSNSTGKSSGVDFDEVTSALNLYLAQWVKGHRPASSFDDLVADHKAYCDEFNQDNIETPELSHLFEHLELKDTVNWQEVFDYNTKKVEDFLADFNKKLKANEAERLLSKETAVEKNVQSKTLRATREASQKNNNASSYKENSEEPLAHQGNGKGKKQKNKAPRPSDSLDWRSSKREHGACQIDKISSPVKKQVEKVEKSEEISTSTAPQQSPRQTSKAGSQKSESLTLNEKSPEKGSEKETGKAEASVRQPGQQRPRAKDKECQALDDMHEMMMKRRQEQKRIKQQHLDFTKENSETVKVISTVAIETDPRKESQELKKEVLIPQEKIIEAKEILIHDSTEQLKSSIRSQQSDIDIINKPLVESYKEDQDVSVIKIMVQNKNIDDIKLNQNLNTDTVKKSVSSKKRQAEGNLGTKVLTKRTEKTKQRKPSKTQARLAGLKVSAGSTSSSSYFSLTSDISDVVLSDMERESQLLKPHCYANKYVEDEQCLLNDSKMSTASSVYPSYYSKEDAYLRDYSISCSSPYVPKTLPSPDHHGQHHVQESEESVANPKLKGDAKSPKVRSLRKQTKSPRGTQEEVTGDSQKNQKKDSKHCHKNSNEKKQKKRNSFPSLQSCESDTESDYSTSRTQGASSRRRPSHYSSLPWQHQSYESLDSLGRRAVAQPPPPHYPTYQPVFNPYMYPVPQQYFPPDYYYSAMYHQWLLQNQYIKAMTKVLTDLHKQWFSDTDNN